jgi:hypothetical protein
MPVKRFVVPGRVVGNSLRVFVSGFVLRVKTQMVYLFEHGHVGLSGVM